MTPTSISMCPQLNPSSLKRLCASPARLSTLSIEATDWVILQRFARGGDFLFGRLRWHEVRDDFRRDAKLDLELVHAIAGLPQRWKRTAEAGHGLIQLLLAKRLQLSELLPGNRGDALGVIDERLGLLARRIALRHGAQLPRFIISRAMITRWISLVPS